MRKALCTLCALCAGLFSSRAAFPAERSLESLMPADVIGYLKLSEASVRLEEFLASDARKDLESLQIVRLGMDQRPWKQLLHGLEEIEDATGKKPMELLHGIFGKEVLVGLKLGFSGPEVILLARSRSEKELEASLGALRAGLESRGVLLDKVQGEGEGPSVETLQGKAYFARTGDLFMASSTQGGIRSVTDLASGASSNSVEKSPFLGKAAGLVPAGQTIALAVRPQFLPNFQIPQKADNALASLLAGGWLEALRSSDVLAVSLGGSGRDLVAHLGTLGGPDGASEKAASLLKSFFPQVAPDGVIERLKARGALAVTTLTRDIAAWWQERESIIENRALGDLLQLSQVMSLAFGGRSFEDEVLPSLGQRITVVARNQEYKELAAAPKPAIPGFALIFELKRPKEFGEDLEAAFQSVVGLINIDRAQKKKDGGMTLRIKPEKVGDVSLFTVTLKSRGDAGELGMEHNFTPSLAVVGSRAVLSSSSELTRLLVSELGEAAAATPDSGRSASSSPASGSAGDRLSVNAEAAAAILAQNKEVIAASTMLKEGISKEEAMGRLDMALEVLQRLQGLELRSRRNGAVTELDLRLGTRLGEGARAEPAAALKGKGARL